MKFNLDTDCFEHFVDAVCIVKPDLKIAYFNHAFTSLIEEDSIRILSKKPVNHFIQFNDFDWKKFKQGFEINIASPILELAYKAKQKEGRLQISWKTIPSTKGTNCILVYLRDVSLEDILVAKYKSEIAKKEETIKKMDRHLFEISLIRDVLERTNGIDDPEFMLKSLFIHIIEKMTLSFAMLLKEEGPKKILSLSHTIEAAEENRSTIRDLSEEIKDSVVVGQKIGVTLSEYHWVAFEYKGDRQQSKFFIYSKKSKFREDDISLLKTMCDSLNFAVDNRELFRKAMTDELTGLYNHRYFKMRLETEVKEALLRKSFLGLVLLDIDHFKQFNDNYGHQIGDLVLKKVADCIKANCRPSDISARYGGEELAIIFTNVSISILMTLAERVRKSIESMKVITDEFGSLSVTASFGVAIYPDQAESMAELIGAADKALYEAKHAGRNRVVVSGKTAA